MCDDIDATMADRLRAKGVATGDRFSDTDLSA
jgi:hypothetical protein